MWTIANSGRACGARKRIHVQTSKDAEGIVDRCSAPPTSSLLRDESRGFTTNHEDIRDPRRTGTELTYYDGRSKPSFRPWLQDLQLTLRASLKITGTAAMMTNRSQCTMKRRKCSYNTKMTQLSAQLPALADSRCYLGRCFLISFANGSKGSHCAAFGLSWIGRSARRSSTAHCTFLHKKAKIFEKIHPLNKNMFCIHSEHN